MKRLISFALVAVVVAMNLSAQSAAEMTKQQQELQSILRKSLDSNPTKEAKNQAKEYKKDGWKVPAGEMPIENQITESQLLGAEYMADEDGTPTLRFIQHTAFAIAGSYNAAYASARTNAMAEIASLLETELASAMEGKLDNAQANGISAVSVDKFNQRKKAIVQESLTNTIPVIKVYRSLPNNNVEVQVRIAFDKKEIAARMKRALQKELETEGDELNSLVDEVLNNTTI